MAFNQLQKMSSAKANQIINDFFKTTRPVSSVSVEVELSQSFVEVKWFQEEEKKKLKFVLVENPIASQITDPSKLLSLVPSFHPNPPNNKKDGIRIPNVIFHGCKHHLMSCKLLCPECKHFYSCRFCHDKNAIHGDMKVDSVTHVFCLNCSTIVPVGEKCQSCKIRFATTYCPHCHYYNSNPFVQSFHCDKCGVCREGKREESFHCDRCGGCYSTDDVHPCRHDSAHDNCAVCRESIFKSRKGVWAGPCGHYMHNKCVYSLFQYQNFKCPLCQEPFISTDYPPSGIFDVESAVMGEDY